MDYRSRLALRDAVEERNCSALGFVLTSFQSLEHKLTEICGYFLDQEDFQIGIIVTSELSFRGLINLAYSLAHHRGMDSKRVQSLREILKDCFAAEQRRNTLIHSYWEPEPESFRVTRYKYSAKYPAGYRHQLEDVSEVDLLKFATEIRELILDLTELMDAHDAQWADSTTFPSPIDPSSSLLPKNLSEKFDAGEDAVDLGSE